MVYIMESIFLIAAIFWDLLFALYLLYTIKLAIKLEFKMQNIANEVIKKKSRQFGLIKSSINLNNYFKKIQSDRLK